MKNKEDIDKIVMNLTQSDIALIEDCARVLTTFTKEKKVNEDGLHLLENALSILIPFRKNYCDRIIRLIKQGNILD